MVSVTYMFTQSCNYMCRMCSYPVSRNGRTASIETSKSILGNLSPNLSGLSLTGGEPLYVQDKLYELLGYINENRESILGSEGQLTISTNGFWLKDNDEAYNIMKQLAIYGVDNIWFSGFTQFHRERSAIIQHWDCEEIPDEVIAAKCIRRIRNRVRKDTGLENKIFMMSP